MGRSTGVEEPDHHPELGEHPLSGLALGTGEALWVVEGDMATCPLVG